jgi:hypothetical protein
MKQKRMKRTMKEQNSQWRNKKQDGRTEQTMGKRKLEKIN